VTRHLTTSADSPAITIEDVAIRTLNPRVRLGSKSHVAQLLATVRVRGKCHVVDSAQNGQAKHTYDNKNIK